MTLKQKYLAGLFGLSCLAGGVHISVSHARGRDRTAHMHLRGKSFEAQVVYPDGRRELLLSVPRYDFNWQHTYVLSKPLPVPVGTRIECVGHFDNSASNPNNPDPKSEVNWGDQSWEEMMLGVVGYFYADPA